MTKILCLFGKFVNFWRLFGYNAKTSAKTLAITLEYKRLQRLGLKDFGSVCKENH
ncbi:hypothetical protein [Helicobacter sp. MIT 01-3238]|uniref:hypothetical protein n=1 Tax=Helicobacter sp. MIT 01-3238 TaxID=398627 RepID=UPI0015F17FAD|nr:hypothetical protein [Helicobacter sp. MIT 01-3238]